MGKTEKRFNKWLIGVIIGGAVLGGMNYTNKGKKIKKGLFGRIKSSLGFFGRGMREVKKMVTNKKVKK